MPPSLLGIAVLGLPGGIKDNYNLAGEKVPKYFYEILSRASENWKWDVTKYAWDAASASSLIQLIQTRLRLAWKAR